MNEPIRGVLAESFLERAVMLAKQGALRVEPNPRVGCVIAHGAQVVGEGAHPYFGGPHAEVEALAAAGGLAAGATLYVTLEPCSTHGKTPPCVEAIARAGIARVVFSVEDPNPRHAGAAIPWLRERGIECVGPIPVAGASELLSRFTRHLASRRPFVVAKWAMTLDGKIATRELDSQWITSDRARERAHRLRGEVDAIAVGGSTVRHDRPRLTARPAGPRVARRVVFSRSLAVPEDWDALRDGGPEVVFLTTKNSPATLRAGFDRLGARVIVLDDAEDAEFVRAGLSELRRLGVDRAMVEGGARLLGSFFDAGCVDQVCAFIAPRIVGGEAALSAVGGRGLAKIDSASRLREVRSEAVDDEVVMEGFLDPID